MKVINTSQFLINADKVTIPKMNVKVEELIITNWNNTTETKVKGQVYTGIDIQVNSVEMSIFGKVDLSVEEALIFITNQSDSDINTKVLNMLLFKNANEINNKLLGDW